MALQSLLLAFSDRTSRQCRPILDREGRVFAVLGGCPRDSGWSDVNDDVCRICEEGRAAYAATSQQASHRRGNYTAVSVGISFGGGQKRVSNLAHAKHNQAVIGSLLQQTSIRRIAAFGDIGLLRLFGPRLHRHYEATLSSVCEHHPELRRNFDRSAFSCSTFNLGPQTRTVPHRDHLNLPYGWCAITAFGNFDPKQGGHIILWDLRMVIEFPPGSTILIPSAILMHSNTAIAPEERRYSFTQYTPGGVFRWVASGFQTVKEAGLSARSLNAAGRKRWEEGVGLLSLWSELCAE
ncbi:hypothetical protein PYCCODRAFT_1358115 [Trametes coccinea BRFM310]|uniref:Prolyl 4-hydroxylase alpha subunit Fe(2+) 2OG dioxygenase domain-containing protein n=1 Tax=Trametes coccinea (strain BRFM310) TaxID=1353009 RepID=A0A1Y2J426_TRAC3|nr:hypothetical protein PYCCODRAFT_1358115 [Trametes coccinea BRFM310]